MRLILAAVAVALLVAACGDTAATTTLPPVTTTTTATTTTTTTTTTTLPPVTSPEEAAARVIATDPRFAGIGPRDPDLIGQARWWVAEAAGDGYRVEVRIGWGDCPSGCIDQHIWTYTVARDGTVTLRKETGAPYPEIGTGVTGLATAGPTCPVETAPPDPACADRPVAGAVIVLTDATGAEVARVTTDADGRFSVALAPGSYTVTPQPVEGLLGTPEPRDVVVTDEAPVDVLLGYDTGIR